MKKGFDMPLADACRLAGVSRRSAMRWLASGRLRPVGRQQSRRGKPSVMVNLDDLVAVARPNRERRPAWVRFRDECVKQGYDGRQVLTVLLLGATQHGNDPDLLRVGIRLVMEGWPDFLPCLFGRDTGEDAFSVFVAGLLRCDTSRLPVQRVSLPTFWKRAQRQVSTWWAVARPAVYTFDGGRRVRLVMRPRFLKEYKGGSVPSWMAEGSVVRVDVELRTLLRSALQPVAAAMWAWKDGVPMVGASAQWVNAGLSSAKIGDIDAAVKYLVRVGCKSGAARSLAWAWFHRHGGQRSAADLAGLSEDDIFEGGGKLSRSAVARVFCVAR